LMWGFQIWVNLPASDKMTTPRYQDLQGDQIPETQAAKGVTARVIAGELAGVTGAVTNVATDPVYLDLHLDAGASLTVPLPEVHNAFLYVYEGQVSAGPASERISVERGELALLSHGDAIDLAAGSNPARLILLAGRPLGEPIARYGPFVMNTNEELRQAFADYQSGRL